MLALFALIFATVAILVLRARRPSHVKTLRESMSLSSSTAGGLNLGYSAQPLITPLKPMKTIFVTAVNGSCLVAELVLIFVLLWKASPTQVPELSPAGQDKLYTAGVALLLARVLQLVPAGYLAVRVLGCKGLVCGLCWGKFSIGSSERGVGGAGASQGQVKPTLFGPHAVTPRYPRLVDLGNIESHRLTYTLVLVLSALDLSALRFWPWLDSPFTRASEGLPNTLVFIAANHCKLVQCIVALGCSFVFLDRCYRHVEDPSSTADASKLSAAIGFLVVVVLLEMISAVATLMDTCGTRITTSTPTAVDDNSASAVDASGLGTENSVNPMMIGTATAGQLSVVTQRLEFKIDDLEKRLERALDGSASKIHLEKPSPLPAALSTAVGLNTAIGRRLDPSGLGSQARGTEIPGSMPSNGNNILTNPRHKAPAPPSLSRMNDGKMPRDSIPQQVNHHPHPEPLRLASGAKTGAGAGVGVGAQKAVDVLDTVTAPSWASFQDEEGGL